MWNCVDYLQYGYIVMVVTNVTRWMGVFQTQVSRNHLFYYLIETVWPVQCMVHYITFFVEYTMLFKFRKFVTSYQEYIDTYRIGMIARKNSAYVWAAVYWIVVFSTSTLDAYFGLSHIDGNHLWPFNSLRPRHNRRHFPDDIFKCIFFNENI